MGCDFWITRVVIEGSEELTWVLNDKVVRCTLPHMNVPHTPLCLSAYPTTNRSTSAGVPGAIAAAVQADGDLRGPGAGVRDWARLPRREVPHQV